MSASEARILHIECVVVKYFDCLISIVFTVSYRHIPVLFRFFDPAIRVAIRKASYFWVRAVRFLAHRGLLIIDRRG